MLEALQGLLGLLLVVVPAVLLPALLAVRDRLWAVLAGLVVAASAVVLVSIGLSLLEALTAAGLLAGHAVVATAAAVAWWLGGRPPLPRAPIPGRRRIAAAARAHPAVAVAAFAAGGALAIQLVVAVAVVPNNWDSMTYHLARAGYWLQQDSLEHYANGTVRQLATPPNVEILQAWTLELFGTDRLANLVQWTSLLGLAGAILAGARILGFSTPAAAFAACLFTILPQPIMQATSTQNDIATSFLVVVTALFAVRGIRDRKLGELVVAALALGLAVGAKGTALFALGSLGVLALGALIAFRPPRRLLVGGAGAAAAAVVVLGSFNYFQNLDTYGDPLGGLGRAAGVRTGSLPENVLRSAWSFVDSPGISIGWAEVAVQRAGNKLFGDLSSRFFPGFTIDTAVQEDTSGYGLVGWLLLPAAIAAALAAPRSPPARRLLAVAVLVYFLTFVVLKPHDPWIARLMMPMVALAAPLLALLYARSWLRTLAIVLALASLAPAILRNPQKPLLVPRGQPIAFAYDRISQQTLIRPEMRVVLRRLARYVGDDEPLGLVGGGDSWDYPFFGPGLIRRVTPLSDAEVTADRIRDERLAGVVYANVRAPRLPARSLARGYWFVPARR